MTRVIRDFDALAERVAAIPGVTRAAPLVKGQVMATATNGNNTGVEVFGIRGDGPDDHPPRRRPRSRWARSPLRRGHRHRLGRGAGAGRGVGDRSG
jgi:lipoprotein-releasing system permease protein